MKLENQVVSLELAKRIKELGVKQESIFFWIERSRGAFLVATSEIGSEVTEESVRNFVEGEIIGFYAAFTVAELGEMLPTYNFQYPYSFKMSSGKEWSACWINAQTQRIIHQVTENTEADARAKMLVYLIENKLIEI